ncbi:MAG: hypothetical protein ACJ79A_15770 [Gemmatimonadaceae bacterium]
MRRTFRFLPSTIALIVVALLASSAGIDALVSRATNAALAAVESPAHPTVDRANGRATEPDVPGRTAFLHAQTPSTARTHASHSSGSDGGRRAVGLGAEQALLDLAARRAPGAAAEARQHGVTPPGQPAPSSRAPPIG